MINTMILFSVMSLKEKAYKTIKEKILTCQYAPGQSINEDMICSSLKISRTPVRDALSRLSQESLIEIKPKKGILISNIKLSDLNDLYTARLFMEPSIILEFGKNADKDKLTSLQQEFLNIDMEAITCYNYTKFDNSFHKYIFSLADNPYFNKFYENLSTMDCRISVLGGLSPLERRKKSKEEHINILQYMMDDDFEKASEEMKAHIIAAKKSKFNLLMNNKTFASYFSIK